MVQKEIILSAASEIVKELGIRNISIDYITKRLNISKKSIYLKYADKDDLLQDVIKNSIVSMSEVLNQVPVQAATTIDEFLLMSDKIIDWAFSWRRSSLQDLEACCPGGLRQVIEFSTNVVEPAFTKNILKGITERHYGHEWNKDLLIRQMGLVIENCLRIMSGSQQHLSFIQIKHHFIGSYLMGVCTDEARVNTRKRLELFFQKRGNSPNTENP